MFRYPANMYIYEDFPLLHASVILQHYNIKRKHARNFICWHHPVILQATQNDSCLWQQNLNLCTESNQAHYWYVATVHT